MNVIYQALVVVVAASLGYQLGVSTQKETPVHLTVQIPNLVEISGGMLVGLDEECEASIRVKGSSQ